MSLDPRLDVRPRLFGIYRAKLISGYGDVRPNAPAQTVHAGWDVGAATGTWIRALGSCTVWRVRDFDSVSGYHQEVTVYYSSANAFVLYGHVLRGIPVSVGARLRQGDIIAAVGTSRDAMWTAPHAHIQAWKSADAAASYSNSRAIDPARVRNWYAPHH